MCALARPIVPVAGAVCGIDIRLLAGATTAGRLTAGAGTARILAPRRSDFRAQILALALGANFTVALDRQGAVWTWGANDFGQLGTGTTVHRSVPVKVDLPGHPGSSRSAPDGITRWP